MEVARLNGRKDRKVLPTEVYIGRRQTMGGWNLPASIWANPFNAKKCGTVAKACEKYEAHVRADPLLLSRLGELEGAVLACWCYNSRDRPGKRCSSCARTAEACGHPQCHGDVLLRLLRERRGGGSAQAGPTAPRGAAPATEAAGGGPPAEEAAVDAAALARAEEYLRSLLEEWAEGAGAPEGRKASQRPD